MTTQTPNRALLVTPTSLTLATPEPDGSTMQLLCWTEAPDGRTRPHCTETVSVEAFAERNPAFNPALSPYQFGLQRYDPFESLGDSLDRAASTGSPLAMALWAAMESDLFRFAYDGGFTSDLELVRDGPEWYRFARLNDLYRAIIRAIVPFGIVPPSWSSWLRNPARPAQRHSRIAALGTRILTRDIGAIHRVILARAEPGSLFIHK
jgi:hypothetical protein